MRIHCQECGQQVERRSATQRFCESCSTQRDLQRKRIWTRQHPPTSQQANRWKGCRQRRTELAREAGLQTNRELKRTDFNVAPPDPELIWMIRVLVPFSYAASKNHLYARRRSGHVFLRRESKAKRAEIAIAVRSALDGQKVAHNKVWIDILVQKPNHYGDAVNVIDLVCDALKDALPVDDRWFCIRRVDWEIVKEDPQLVIGIGQDSVDDAQVCSYCGQIKPLEAFNRDKSCPLGVGRECRDCRRVGRLLTKQAADPCIAN